MRIILVLTFLSFFIKKTQFLFCFVFKENKRTANQRLFSYPRSLSKIIYLAGQDKVKAFENIPLRHDLKKLLEEGLQLLQMIPIILMKTIEDKEGKKE